jgi:hypothetical protein
MCVYRCEFQCLPVISFVLPFVPDSAYLLFFSTLPLSNAPSCRCGTVLTWFMLLPTHPLSFMPAVAGGQSIVVRWMGLTL